MHVALIGAAEHIQQPEIKGRVYGGTLLPAVTCAVVEGSGPGRHHLRSGGGVGRGPSEGRFRYHTHQTHFKRPL